MSVLEQIPWWVWIPVGLVVLFWWAATAGTHRARPKPLRNGVMGTARVISINSRGHHEGRRTGRVVMHVILQGPSVAPTSARYEAALITTVWPEVGMDLPASIDPTRPTRFRILWGDVSNGTAGVMRQSSSTAERGSRSGGYPLSHSPNGTVMLNGRPVEFRATRDDAANAAPQVSAAFPRDLQQKTGTGALTEMAPLLERLAALRDRGILTQAEFEAQKGKILGS